ncbi:expressed protein [Echinococcus multilocularis]|uniref:Expressed protein n=1 Tax=Echinococcus multilocularis TaxID=6211 RepID=A0A068Y1Q2_ECHMU|nr:expressed protein [Echinococcus multilocularis]
MTTTKRFQDPTIAAVLLKGNFAILPGKSEVDATGSLENSPSSLPKTHSSLICVLFHQLAPLLFPSHLL